MELTLLLTHPLCKLAQNSRIKHLAQVLANGNQLHQVPAVNQMQLPNQNVLVFIGTMISANGNAQELLHQAPVQLHQQIWLNQP